MATLTSADLFAQYPELTTTDADSLIRIGTFLDIAEQVIVVGFSTTAQLTRCQWPSLLISPRCQTATHVRRLRAHVLAL